jgi:hypothetical protein
MKPSNAGRAPGNKPAPRRRRVPLIITLLWVAALTIFMLCLPVVIVAMVIVRALGAMLSSIFSSLHIDIMAALFQLIATLVEVLWLLQMGEYVRFAMRAIETLISPVHTD